jgi:hypothetical protein
MAKENLPNRVGSGDRQSRAFGLQAPDLFVETGK